MLALVVEYLSCWWGSSDIVVAVVEFSLGAFTGCLGRFFGGLGTHGGADHF